MFDIDIISLIVISNFFKTILVYYDCPSDERPGYACLRFFKIFCWDFFY